MDISCLLGDREKGGAGALKDAQCLSELKTGPAEMPPEWEQRPSKWASKYKPKPRERGRLLSDTHRVPRFQRDPPESVPRGGLVQKKWAELA